MKYGPRKTAEVAAKAFELQQAGLQRKDIANQLGVSCKWITYWLEKLGYPPAKVMVRTTPENIMIARQMRLDGVCWKLIGREMGCNWRTFQRAIWAEDREARANAQ